MLSTLIKSLISSGKSVMTKSDLMRMAKERGIKTYPGGRPLRKDELVDALRADGVRDLDV